VGNILQEATYPQTKCGLTSDTLLSSAARVEGNTFNGYADEKNLDIALQVLDDVIMTRWKVLPRDQCQGNDGLL
jgi:exportin-1